LNDTGLEVLLDDREERPGAKFKDADLTGIPYRITVGNKLKDNYVELMTRKTKQVRLIAVPEIVQEAIATIRSNQT
jgi:prolyl-tRNA synthetase